ncbi:M2 family metallopeptidase, partial [Salmonella sp. s55044]|uniref:M2 family metallopeptidase n=1 Tax=Salmonella sp. s55044 TaxID=3159677 RepID=UPI00397FC30D
KCDIYESQDAGVLLSNMLKTGSKQPWPEAMEAITGQRSMSAEPLIEYFQPLITCLEVENTLNNEYLGWDNAPNWKPAAPQEWTGAGSAVSHSKFLIGVL